MDYIRFELPVLGSKFPVLSKKFPVPLSRGIIRAAPVPLFDHTARTEDLVLINRDL